MNITWSGYNGTHGHRGNEYITITGETSEMLVMKVFGYQAGEADVTYSWGDIPELTVANVHASNIEKNSAKILWDLSDYATGQVEYGETTAYGQLSTKETSYNYDSHGQILRNLQQGTTYHYRVISEDRYGQEVISDDYTFTTLSDNGYADLGNYTPKLYTNAQQGDNRYIAYYPENGISADMPVVMFIKGGGSGTIESYNGIMKFLASKGYYTLGVDANSYSSEYVTSKLELALDDVKARRGLNVSKLVIMGHSLGGGQVFHAMKKFRDDGYGNEGSLALSIDGWFSFSMNAVDLNQLDSNVTFIQMNGVDGTGTDPRIRLTIWNLSTLANRSFYTLPENNHNYVQGDLDNILQKDDLRLMIGALTHDVFKDSIEGVDAIPQSNKSSYDDIYNALQDKSTYVEDCAGVQYNAIEVIKDFDIDYCTLDQKIKKYPPETLFNKLVVDPVDRPAHKFDSYVDRTFDNKVKRVVTRLTDREKDNKGFNSHPYPKQGTAWNSDMTLLKFVGRIYDAQTLEEVPLTRDKLGGEVNNLMKTPQSGSSGIRWSKHNPNVLYVMSSKKKFYKLTINEERTALEEELIIDLSNMPYPFFNIGQNEGNIDYADRYVVLTSIIDDDVYATLLDIKSKQLVWEPKKLDIDKEHFDWISISPSGNYILINEHKSGEDGKMHLYNRNLEKIRTLANYSQHGDICYDQDGNEMYVQLLWGGRGIFGFILNNSPQYQEPIKLLDSNYGGGHVSCRNYKRKGWAYVSTKQHGYRDVFALKLDDSKKVQRFAKTHTGGYSMAVPSPDGTRVLFMSNFSNPNYKYDTYQVRISKGEDN